MFNNHRTHNLILAVGMGTSILAGNYRAAGQEKNTPELDQAGELLRNSCLDCHSEDSPEGGLNLQPFINQTRHGQLAADSLDEWIRIFDRVEQGEMPPEGGLPPNDRTTFASSLKGPLVELDRQQVAGDGRTVWRRMNRQEYAQSLRELLGAPWLPIENMLPADGIKHGFNKSGFALDVSHVNMSRYLQAADASLREILVTESRPKTKRYYAREQNAFNRRVHYNPFNRSPERATFPLIGYQADLDVLNIPDHPFTVGSNDPEIREQEAFGVVASSYEPIEVQFNSFVAPQSGRYKLRFHGYTFWAHGEEKRWWRPDREQISKGRRGEPVVIYSRSPPRQLRRIGEFDFAIEPSTQEIDVWLLKGETIQPDAVRLFRSRPPGGWHNPLAEKDGMPGVAFQWMETEGPLPNPAAGKARKLLFGDLTLVKKAGKFQLASAPEATDTRRLIAGFLAAAYRSDSPIEDSEVDRFCDVINAARSSGATPTDALLAGYTAILCSPEFVCVRVPSGRLDAQSALVRLSLFLHNALPNQDAREPLEPSNNQDPGRLDEMSGPEARMLAEEMLNDPHRNRFVEAFLDYWLQLRSINDTSPDENLYSDYYLDDALVDAARSETQLFFDALITDNLPITNLVQSNFTFLNERLAKHYHLPKLEGVQMRRTALPPGSVRGGLLTQASILKVTANGTTTSPVVRGTFVNERILGIEIPPPPPSVPAIEPDTRGATTIREQLDLHRSDASCNACHRIIDPAGFALESFDVAGGYRDRYRSLPDEPSDSGTNKAAKTAASTNSATPVEGFGKNGQPFRFVLGPEVDPSGTLPNGQHFSGVRELKQLLAARPRQLARNFVKQLVTYATGQPPRFSDRDEVERILDQHESSEYRVRDLIIAVASSDMFLHK
ncbi:MAG TPA: hypothetical protein DDW52_12040 [Planctomycetaceae bacterium]|nr:hypothetical protein [Planctomycetaceae bacterium]